MRSDKENHETNTDGAEDHNAYERLVEGKFLFFFGNRHFINNTIATAKLYLVQVHYSNPN